MKKRLIVFLIALIIAIVVICIISKDEESFIEPNDAYYKSESNNNSILANRGSFSWSDGTKYLVADAIGPTAMNYDVTLNVKENEIVYFENVEGIIKSVYIYDAKDKEDVKLDYSITFDAREKYIVVPELIGEYIVEINTLCDKGEVWYSIKLNINE